VLPLVEEGDVWIKDRNFCVVDFLLGVKDRLDLGKAKSFSP